MPARPKVNSNQIIAATRALLERKGRDGFSLSDVASAVGVQAPSLYGHFVDRAALLQAVELALWGELGKTLTKASAKRPLESLKRQARAYRRFAKKNPNGYALMFDVNSPTGEKGRRARADSLVPALKAFADLVGEAKALPAARVLTPYLHGFVSMENAAAFRMGPGIEAAFEFGLEAVLRGLKT